MPASRTPVRLLVSILPLAALFVLTLPLVTPRIYASDEVQYFSYLRSLWFDRDVSFENEYRHFYDSGIVRYPGFHETFLERQTETGRRISFATIGSALLWSPFYAVADIVVRVRRAGGDPIPADGYSGPYVAAVAYGSAVYGWLSLVLGFLIIRRVVGDGGPHGRLWRDPALLATLAVWVGTPLFFYMYVAPPMSHACSAFAVALFIFVWLRVREQWSVRGMVALGALAALMAMVREQDLFIAIGPAVDWIWTLARRPRRSMIAPALAGIAAFALAWTPQLAAYLALNGYPGPSRLVARKMNWMSPHAAGVLASPQHGLLVWTPLVALALVGLVLLAWYGAGGPRAAYSDAAHPHAVHPDAARIGLCALLMIAGQVYVAGSVESWTVAGAFGQRRFVGLSALFVLGLAALWAHVPPRWPRRILLTIGALAIWWQLGLMAQFGAGLMDRQRLDPKLNAYHTFITIPQRLPELIYRYIFERRSFFQRTS